MRIAVDFDGTIVKHDFPAIGKEIPFAFETLRKLAGDGHHLILWTYRWGSFLDEAVKLCQQNGVMFYAINQNHPDEEFDHSKMSRKIDADIYIDDRNLGGLTGWKQIYEMISSSSTRKISTFLRPLAIFLFLLSMALFFYNSTFFTSRENELTFKSNPPKQSQPQNQVQDANIKEEIEQLTALIANMEKLSVKLKSSNSESSNMAKDFGKGVLPDSLE